MPSEFKINLFPTGAKYVLSEAVVNVIYSGRGEGKCLHPDTEVIMYDGRLKKVKDIVVDDKLMGDDSTPRNVLSVCSGTDDMYEVIPMKGESFICNKEHILVLDATKVLSDLEEVHIAVKDFILDKKYFGYSVDSEQFSLIKKDIHTWNKETIGIKEIKYLGKGKYCGFTLDGNHKFLLGSFIVSHNTVASIAALFIHAQRNGCPIRCAIVRDTHENIKISTARSIQDTLPASIYKFKNDYKELEIMSNPPIQVDLFGIDDYASLSKFQGSEYSLIWLEEPAPMSDRSNAGIMEEVFNAALISCTRQKKTLPRLQISMNPADQEHWTYRRFFEDECIDPDNPLITRAVFAVPYGENTALPEVARQAVKAAYKHDPASYQRYVENKFVPLQVGKAVTPQYGSGKYVHPRPLRPCKGLEGFRAYDGWHHPSCLLGQITHSGRLVFIDTVAGENCDIGILIKQKVLPLLNSPRWKGLCKSWRDIGDISMKTPDQSNIAMSAAKVIEEIFGTYFEAGPARWEHIKRGIDNAFATNIVGKPAFVVNPENRLLDKALSGGWHYKTDNAGNVMGDIPEKSPSSHIGDAFANAVNVLLPSQQRTSNKAKLQTLRRRARARAAGYSV